MSHNHDHSKDVRPEHVMLDLGPGVGALVLHTAADLHGVEIEGEAAVVGPVPRSADEDPQTPELAEPERLMAAKYQHPGGGMIHDGRHAWLRITPAKITSWDFRKLASLPPRPGA